MSPAAKRGWVAGYFLLVGLIAGPTGALMIWRPYGWKDSDLLAVAIVIMGMILCAASIVAFLVAWIVSRSVTVEERIAEELAELDRESHDTGGRGGVQGVAE